MTDSVPEVKITIAGDLWDQWSRLEITLGLEELAPQFILETFDFSESPDDVFPFVEGDECTIDVKLPGSSSFDRILTGYVERPELSDGPDDGDIRVTATGSSKAVDLVQCHAEPKRWNDADLFKIASDLCRPFGIDVYSFDSGEPVKRFETQPGQPVCDALQKLAEHRGLIVTCDRDGAIVMTEAETQKSGVNLRAPGNIIRGTAVGDFSDRFSQYTVFSQRTPESKFYAEDAAGMKVEITDDQVRRFRPYYTVSDRDEKPAELEARAKYIRNLRAGRSRIYSCEVEGWDDGRGVVWSPNTLVSVQHKRVGIDDDLLVSRVVLMADADAGFGTHLDLARPETFNVLATPEDEGRGRRSRF